MLVEVDHPTAGTVKLAGIPVKFSATPASVRLPPPLLGQHTEDVLSSWLGMNIEEIEQLKEKERPMNGKTFEEFHAGERYTTGRRTITEHDILTFVISSASPSRCFSIWNTFARKVCTASASRREV